MPVDGLPNPHLHRLCKRCGRWFALDEGSAVARIASGPLDWVRLALRRWCGLEEAPRFLCFPCQALQAGQSRSWWTSLLVILALAVALAIAWRPLVAWLATLFGPGFR